MIEACEAAGVKLSLAKISRWLEAVKVGHDLIADGVAGDLVAIHVHRLFRGYPNTGWPLDPAEGGVARLGQPEQRRSSGAREIAEVGRRVLNVCEQLAAPSTIDATDGGSDPGVEHMAAG